MEVTASPAEIVAVDSSGRTVRIRPDGWESADVSGVESVLSGRIDGPATVDGETTGRTRGLAFSGVTLTAVSLSDGSRERVSAVGDDRSLPADDYLVKAESGVRTFLSFSGSAHLSMPSMDASVLSFPEPTPVSVGFVSPDDESPGVVVVPETPDGVADALSTLAATPEVTDARRSWPSLRPRPPAVRFGPDAAVPDSVATAGRSAVTVRVRPVGADLLSVASLAYYLGARVETERGVTPHLALEDRRVSPGEPLDERAGRLLRRVFWLDCLVRSASDYGDRPAAADGLGDVGIDPAVWHDAPMAERVGRYLDAPFERIADAFPQWHLSIIARPHTTHLATLAPTLPTLPTLSVRSGGVATTARASPPAGDRRGTTAANGDRAAVTVGAGTARLHGWLGERTATDAFDLSRAAVANRDRYLTGSDRLSFVAVVNDAALAGGAGETEASRVERRYRSRNERFGQDVTVRRNCTVAEVARIVESGVDVFHFVGHHDDGLACADGSLSVDALAESNARTFLLNACGSAPFGAGLVRKGSVAGAVTLDPVTDETAVRFGTAFAGLLAGGFSVASAVERARRTLLVPRQYTVVGDGTHLVTDNTGTESAVIDLERLGPGRFRVEQEHWILTNPGGQWVGGLDDTARLKGQSTSNVVSAAELDEFLAAAVPPVLFEGDLHRPSALRAELDLSA